MPKAEDYLVGIDIGSSKVGVLIGQLDDSGGVEVVGKGMARNKGTRRGNIVNVELTVESLRSASEEAEVMAGVEISRAYVGLGSSDIRSLNSRAMVTVSRDDREITRDDIMRVMEAARSTAVPSDREILHAIPQEFVVDDQGGIEDPMGMLGTRLESLVHLVVGNITRTKTLATCVNRAGMQSGAQYPKRYEFVDEQAYRARNSRALQSGGEIRSRRPSHQSIEIQRLRFALESDQQKIHLLRGPDRDMFEDRRKGS